MQRSGRQNPRLKEKLDALQREIARMETDIKGISRAVESVDPGKALSRLPQGPGVSRRDLPAGPRPVVPGGRPPGGDEFARQRPPSSAPVYEEVGGPLPRAVPDQRFNTYFGSGSLHSVRPLRQERRIQRNKAIFMLVMAALLISLLLKMIF